jgi:putative NADH-flavin reductase
MKIALIGATGFVGSAILNEAINRGHEVTAISRHPEKIKVAHSHVTAVKGNILNEEEVVSLVKDHEAVIGAYNPGWDNPDIYNESLKGLQTIQNGIRKSGVKRYIVVGGAGSLYITPGVQLVDSPQFPAEWKSGALAARDYLDILKKEEILEWTFLSPAIEMHQGTSGIRKGTYRSGLDNPVFDENGKSIISVEDIAVAIIDELEHPKHIRQRFTVAY